MVAKQTMDAFQKTKQLPAFGLGRVEEESKCKNIHVFMTKVGRVSEIKRRIIIPPHKTLDDAKKEFEELDGTGLLPQTQAFSTPLLASEICDSLCSSGVGRIWLHAV